MRARIRNAVTATQLKREGYRLRKRHPNPPKLTNSTQDAPSSRRRGASRSPRGTRAHQRERVLASARFRPSCVRRGAAPHAQYRDRRGPCPRCAVQPRAGVGRQVNADVRCHRRLKKAKLSLDSNHPCFANRCLCPYARAASPPRAPVFPASAASSPPGVSRNTSTPFAMPA